MSEPGTAGRSGIYPGSFNPPTVAHLAIAEAALHQRRLSRVVLSLSVRTLAKEHVDHPRFADRVAVVRESVAELSWIEVMVTEHQLLVDIATGHDVLIMGADKWAQINDPRWYGGSVPARDRALARLPELAIAPRPPVPVPEEHRLVVAEEVSTVSSTRARQGALDLMTPAARRFAHRSGAWLDPDRYEATHGDP